MASIPVEVQVEADEFHLIQADWIMHWSRKLVLHGPGLVIWLTTRSVAGLLSSALGQETSPVCIIPAATAPT